jgi:hypothetical protein
LTATGPVDTIEARAGTIPPLDPVEGGFVASGNFVGELGLDSSSKFFIAAGTDESSNEGTAGGAGYDGGEEVLLEEGADYAKVVVSRKRISNLSGRR